MNKTHLIEEGYNLFAEFERPGVFHPHFADDPESENHESLLQKRDLKTLCLEDVACIGFNPITGINAEGMAYFMPRLIELALDIEQISEAEREPYLWAFILQLMPDHGLERFSLFAEKHIGHMCKVLEFIAQKHITFIRTDKFEEEFLLTLNAWKEMHHQ